MRMAQINLPILDNNGNHLWEVNGQLKRMLSNHFGGYTKLQGTGGWKDAKGQVIQEEVYVYQVAMHDTPSNCETLRQIAMHIGTIAEQQAMFIMLPSGQVEIVDIV